MHNFWYAAPSCLTYFPIIVSFPCLPTVLGNTRRTTTLHPIIAPSPVGTTENLFGRQIFDDSHHLRHTVSRHRLNQKMDMILIRANLQKFQLVTLLDIETNILQYFIDYCIKDRSSILGRKNQVIQQNRNIMPLMNILQRI